MKKLFGLFLFLSISSFLSAGLMIDKPAVAPGESFVISFTHTGEVAGLRIRNVTDSASGSGDTGGLITAETLNAALSVGTKTMEGIDADRSTAVLQATSGSEALGGIYHINGGFATGEIFTITVSTSSSVGAGTYTINFVEGSWKNSSNVATDLGSIDYTIVPEPAAIVLLSLGGVFIRRRS